MTVKNSQASGWNSRNKWNVAIALIFVNYFLRRQPWLLLCTMAKISLNCLKITFETGYGRPIKTQPNITQMRNWQLAAAKNWNIGTFGTQLTFCHCASIVYLFGSPSSFSLHYQISKASSDLYLVHFIVVGFSKVKFS